VINPNGACVIAGTSFRVLYLTRDACSIWRRVQVHRCQGVLSRPEYLTNRPRDAVECKHPKGKAFKITLNAGSELNTWMRQNSNTTINFPFTFNYTSSIDPNGAILKDLISKVRMLLWLLLTFQALTCRRDAVWNSGHGEARHHSQPPADVAP
jgi:hypothetical protein